MKIVRMAFIGMALVASVGCSTPKQVKLDEDGYASVVIFKAEKRGVYFIKKPDGTLAVLSEPSPDVTKEFTASLDAMAKHLSTDAEGSVKAGFETQVVDLAKRSQTLQILRESLFRLSEMNANGGITPEAKALYERVLKSVEMIALAELGNSGLPDKAKEQVVADFYGKVGSGGLTNTDAENEKEEKP